MIIGGDETAAYECLLKLPTMSFDAAKPLAGVLGKASARLRSSLVAGARRDAIQILKGAASDSGIRGIRARELLELLGESP